MSFPKPFFRWRPHPWHGLETGKNPPEVVTAYIGITPFDTVKLDVDKETYKLVPGEEPGAVQVDTIYGADYAFKVIRAAMEDYEEMFGGVGAQRNRRLGCHTRASCPDGRRKASRRQDGRFGEIRVVG